MPSPRKRIGFLPSSEVQKIIDEICSNSKLSQSRVTGMLVEEALGARGLITMKVKDSLIDSEFNINNLFIHFKKDTNMNNNYFYFDEITLKEEIQMINDFIEYKFFKKIVNENKKNI